MASHPFLSSPYAGWTSIVSFFDHDLPSYSQDGLVVTAVGLSAEPTKEHREASDFPAYWNGELRQYLYYDGHNGYDYNLDYQPVYAAAPGKVIFAAYEYPEMPHTGYGKMVMINHRNGYVTLYGHFSHILVKPGQKVRRGEQIGISGNTGHSSGPHLHFSVFHNCKPTDPYGWTGQGSDPLEGYQGESSEYLWLRAPLIANPLPAWPGLHALPAAPPGSLVLLRLPSVSGGPAAFASSVQGEIRRAMRLLGPRAGDVHPDVVRDALDIVGPIAPWRLYTLPGVVSIGADFTAGDARTDVLAALARAWSAHPPLKAHRPATTGAWKGYVFRWQGQTFLFGKASRGTRVALRFNRGKQLVTARSAGADPATGAYALDLGRLSSHDLTLLQRNLQHPVPHHRALTEQPVHRSRKPTHRRRPTEDASTMSVMLTCALIALLGLSMIGIRAVRNRNAEPSALPDHPDERA